MKLSRKVRFTDKVQPIKMPKGGFSYQGYQAYVSGWGIQSPYEGPSSVLKGAELVVSSYLIFLFSSHSGPEPTHMDHRNLSFLPSPACLDLRWFAVSRASHF